MRFKMIHVSPGKAPVFLLAVMMATVSGCGDISARGTDTPTMVPETEEVFRIGSVSGGSWETFSNIVSVGFDAEGHLYVLDGTERRTTVVDSEGALLRAFGEAGQGPGQLRSPLAMAVLPDGRVVISDSGHRSLLLFDDAGRFVRSIPLGDGVSAPSILLPHGEGGIVYAARPFTGPMAGGGARQTPLDMPIYRVDVDAGSEPELLHRAWLPAPEPPRMSEGQGGTRITRQLRAFEPQLHVAALPDGSIAIVDSTSYTIKVGDEGVPEVLERPISPIPVTDRERERERARRLREIDEGGGPAPVVMGMGPGGGAPSVGQAQRRAILESQLETMVFWPEIQVIQDLRTDREGRIWVQRFGDIDAPGPIDIWGKDRSLLATVPANRFEVPAAFGPGGVAAWIEHDDLDVPFVRVARLKNVP